MTELADLGLSSYEEKVYRALLALGTATAGTVSEHSDVPRGRIYDVLNGLEARGIVDSRSGEPRQYEPVAPETVADRLLDERLRELETERERYEALADRVGSDLAPTPPTGGNVWTTTLGSDDAVTLLREQLRAASDRVYVAVGAPYETAPWEAQREEFDAFVEELRPDLDVRLLVSDALAANLADRALPLLEAAEGDLPVRAIPDLQVTFDVVDDASAYLDVPHPFVGGQRFGFVAVEDESIASQLASEFEAAWAEADPLR